VEHKRVEPVALAEVKPDVQELAAVELSAVRALLHDHYAVPACAHPRTSKAKKKGRARKVRFKFILEAIQS